MFGYVTPCIPELKVKEYYKFKSYYCGLCKSIKTNYGNLPRFSLNYDMTFLAIIIHSLSNNDGSFKKCFCPVHPLKKNLIMENNPALDYASFCNVILFYYKLLDDFNDDKSIKSKILSGFLTPYLKNIPGELQIVQATIESKLKNLYIMENATYKYNLDEYSHNFADLTGFLLSNYFSGENFQDNLYWLGYNLGKWIYIIDAFDDLEDDMKKHKFNPINHYLNTEKKSFIDFSQEIEGRIDFTLVTCANNCLIYMRKLPINKNKTLLENILMFGLMEKMDKVFKRSDVNYEQSL
ncbi:DUF5685 family protein [Clostridium sp. KNHs214]|uniref:DUF5685 family protein n=1 Tax=Clostridium sp. KNHs214 TaxID=1540257 RepID=UPI000553C748|nr:DUF5685 family protein [Clostridium sp. KNHs214]